MKPNPQDHRNMLHRTIGAAVIAVIDVFGSRAIAGGLARYEISSRDAGLASAGYSARAQDATTVMTNPAGMVRLAGTQAGITSFRLPVGGRRSAKRQSALLQS
jgi:long-subunit fatty acid transport protein